jgi:hypothetical protein
MGEKAVMTPDDVRQAVAEGVRDALNDPATTDMFCANVLASMQKRAAHQTGRMLLGGLIGIAKRALAFLALGLILYNIGGWALIVKTYKAVLP